MFSRILIANRGKIALRDIRACREMGSQTVAVYSTADRDAAYLKLADQAICIGKAPSTPPDFHTGFVDSIRSAATRLGATLEQVVSEAHGIYHGCTVGTNALVEGRTAPVSGAGRPAIQWHLGPRWRGFRSFSSRTPCAR